jgi:hypothetical protein
MQEDEISMGWDSAVLDHQVIGLGGSYPQPARLVRRRQRVREYADWPPTESSNLLANGRDANLIG